MVPETAHADLGPSGHDYRLDIQGLRGIAVALVVAFHAGLPLPGGFIGVDVFFVISGFVITRLLLREIERSGAIRFRDFYARRAKRLLPALAITIIVTIVLGLGLLSPLGPQETTARTGMAAAVFSANTYLASADSGYFGLEAEENALLHTWSLSVEEQFYLGFPLLLLVLWRIGARWSIRHARAVLVLGLLGVAAASLSFSIITSSGRLERFFSSPQQVAFYSAPSRAWEFLAGALLVFVARRLESLPRSVGAVGGVIGVALVGGSALLMEPGTSFPAPLAIAPVAGTMMLLVAGATAMASILALKPLVSLGDLSYGWYLWHWPLIVFARNLWRSELAPLMAAVAALGIAVVVQRVIENPLRFSARLAGWRVVGMAAGCALVPVVIGWMSISVSRSLVVDDLAAAYRWHLDVPRGCDSSEPLSGRDLGNCTWDVSDERGTIVLVGDSNAGHFAEAVTEAGNALGYDVIVATKSGCPFVGLSLVDDGREESQCDQFVNQTVDDLVEMKPDLVIVASASHVYISSTRYSIAEGGEMVSGTRRKSEVWEHGVRMVAAELDAAGIRTIFVHPVASQPDWSLLQCVPLRQRFFPESCEQSRSRADVDADRVKAVRAEAAGVAGLARASTLDPIDLLCDARVCPTRRDGEWLYRDESHLSVGAAQDMTPFFKSSLDSAE